MCREKKIGRMYIYDQHLSICIPVPKFFFLLARTASSLYKKTCIIISISLKTVTSVKVSHLINRLL